MEKQIEMATVGAKKSVTATIKIDWLLYDIMNETYLRGRTIQNKDNHKEVASMFASEDEENREKILRSVKRAFSQVKSEISEYLDETGTGSDNIPHDGTSDLVLNLKMPSNFNEAATSGIAEAVHDYIKNIAVSDWYLVTNKADSADYFQLAAGSMVMIQQAVSKRSRPSKPLEKVVTPGDDVEIKGEGS